MGLVVGHNGYEQRKSRQLDNVTAILLNECNFHSLAIWLFPDIFVEYAKYTRHNEFGRRFE